MVKVRASVMNRPEFEQLRDLPGKIIRQDIRFSRSRATSPVVVADGIVVENALPADLQVVFTVRDGVLRIEGRAPERPNVDPKVEELTGQILAAVVDEYHVVVENGMVCFACSRRLPETA